jgi:hypothetical protein
MTTQAIGTFGVYGRPRDDEITILAMADEYREKLCAVLHLRHRAVVDLRNTSYPDLYAAMSELEAVKSAIYSAEKSIKEHHSETRDRNAVTDEQRSRLTQLRKTRTHWLHRISELRPLWSDVLRARALYWSRLAHWKDVKTLAKREDMYAAVQWPATLSPYLAIDAVLQSEAEALAASEGRDCNRRPLSPRIDSAVIAQLGVIEMACDLEQRRLSFQFQGRGLHSAIRAEIVEASQPKLTKTGSGMRYEYHRDPEPRPWQKLSLHFPTGLAITELLSGDNPSLSLSPIYTQHASHEHTVYDCRQQIGTAGEPRVISYRVKFHRQLPEYGIVRRWTLAVRDSGKREVIPIVQDHGLVKPTGDGVFGYDVTWRSTPDGIQVCHFVGVHVNERLILPRWLIDARLSVSAAQREGDHLANEIILEHTGAEPPVGGKQGMHYLEDYCSRNPTDTLAHNELHDFQRTMAFATKRMKRAVRCIEKIYETVTYRVCSLHSQIINDPIDLMELKRYDTRDLLRYDPLPSRSREYLAAVSPGKLKALLNGYGLASGDVEPEILGTARIATFTDLFTSFVRSLAVKTGTKRDSITSRSQHAALEVSPQ